MDYKLIFNVVIGIILVLVLYNFLIFVFNKKKRNLFNQKINSFFYIYKDRFLYYSGKYLPNFPQGVIVQEKILNFIEPFYIRLNINAKKNVVFKVLLFIILWPLKIIFFIVFFLIYIYIFLFIVAWLLASVFVTGTYIYYLFFNDNKEVNFVEYGNSIMAGGEGADMFSTLPEFFSSVATFAGALLGFLFVLGIVLGAWSLIGLIFSLVFELIKFIWNIFVGILKEFFK